MAVNGQNHSMFAGESKSFSVTVTNESTGALVDMTSATISWVLKDGTETAVLTKTVGAGITITGIGTLTIALVIADTVGLSGSYRHECRVLLSDGTTQFTAFTGTLTISPTLV